MHLVGHDDEPDAAGLELEQLISQNAEQDSLRLVEFKSPAVVVPREGDEVNVQGTIDSAKLAHSKTL
jgi:hypothetical protein